MGKKRLDSIEQSFLALDSVNTSQVISILCLLDKPIEEKLLRARFEQVITNFPRLNCLFRPPFWIEDPNFNPQDNLIFINPTEEDSFKTICEDLYSTVIDSRVPPWKILLISGKPAAAHFIFHHSFSDGMGIMEFIKTLCGKSIKTEKVTTPNNKAKGLLAEASKLLTKDFLKSKCASPINGKNSPLRKYAFLNLPLTEINYNRKFHQVSLHEYMLGLTCSAIGNYFKNNNSALTTLNVLTPVSHRHPKSSLPFGNYLTGMAVDLDLTDKGPGERLHEIKYKFRISMEKGEDQVYIYLANIVAKLPASIRKVLCNFSASRTNLICSSVPSTGKEQLELLGSKITHQYGTAALMKGHGLSLAFTRYLDSMCICIVSDPQIIKDPEMILKLISNAHTEFSSCLSPQRNLLNA